MPLFSAKLDYALRAVIDIAQQHADIPCQSREIAERQNIRGPYLDQILAVLKREGIVRSIRGAGGGYVLARPASKISVGDIVRAIVGEQLLVSDNEVKLDPYGSTATWIVREFQENIEAQLVRMLDFMSLEEMVSKQRKLEDSLSIMPSI